MNKQELIDAVAASLDGCTKKQINDITNCLLTQIVISLSQGDKVTLVGFGTFDIRRRKARTGRNPKTNETMEIPAATVPHFSPGKNFKDEVARLN